ncbi:hypothetical protein [Paenibacillus alkalitolerans]|uniref:hypothetical protein n=1 Tax=Paenibacillus alkalitolerans TaxID=2799335 RepID=UPI0018F742C0|nr:hypothetical protein [Paenibacillus alkalitolerans]
MIHAKRMLMLGTLAVAVALGSQVTERETVKADPSSKTMNRDAEAEEFLRVLGASTEEEVKDALYAGATLAEIARSNDRDPQDVVRLQVRGLSQQLELRLERGNISPETFALQMEEIEEIVKHSVYGKQSANA